MEQLYMFELSNKLLAYAKKKQYDEWTVKKAVFFISEGKFDEAEEFCDVNDFWINDKWVIFPFDSNVKELLNCLREQGFDKNGLVGYKSPEGYFLFDTTELPKALAGFNMRNPEVSIDKLCSVIIRCYAEYQNPMNEKFFIPKLHKFLNEVVDYEV